MAFWVLCVRLRAGSKFFVKLALHNACSQVSVRLVGTGSVPKLKCRVNKPWSLAWEITIPNVLKWLMSANPYWGSTWEHLWHEIEFSSCWCTRRWQKVGLTWRRRLRLWKMISGWNKQRRGPLVATQKKYFVVSEISSVCFVVRHRDTGKSYFWRRSIHWFEGLLRSMRNDRENSYIESTSALHLISSWCHLLLVKPWPYIWSILSQEWGWKVLSNGPSTTRNGPRNIR